MSATLLNSNADVVASNASTFSASQTVNTGGSNVVAVAHLNVEVNAGGVTPTLGAVTYGGVTMTAAGAPAVIHTESAVAEYVLAAPATGSNTLAWSISNGPASSLIADLQAFQGVNQSTPVRPGSYNTFIGSTSSATASLTITSQTGDITTTVASSDDNSEPLSSTNQTLLNIDNGGATSFGTDYAPGASSVTHTWSWSLAVINQGIAGFSLNGSVGPTINVQPTNQRIYPGQSATFSITATPLSGTLTYQWYKNGSSISGATSSTLSVSPNYPADQGNQYYCIVTDSIGSAQSNTVEAIWILARLGNVPMQLLALGDEDFKSDLVLKRWF